MTTNKYKILVLSDLKESTKSTLKTSVSLSKMLNADIELFHVKKPTDIIETYSQLSAMRNISSEHISIEKEIANLTAPILKDYGVTIKSSFAFGNVKSEIDNKIHSVQPDIIVIGKRKQKTLSFTGDNMTEFIVNTHRSAVMIASNTYGLEPEKDLTLGFYNNEKQPLNLKFIDELIAHTQQPLRSFSIVDKASTKEKLLSTTNKTVDYIFENNNNAVTNLSSYLVKNKVNLLCVSKGEPSNKENIITSELKDVLSKIEISLFLTDERLSNVK